VRQVWFEEDEGKKLTVEVIPRLDGEVLGLVDDSVGARTELFNKLESVVVNLLTDEVLARKGEVGSGHLGWLM
jgi:hypothetical protein